MAIVYKTEVEITTHLLMQVEDPLVEGREAELKYCSFSSPLLYAWERGPFFNK